MTEFALKRFWEKAEVTLVDVGYTVTLDGRSVKTPSKALLVVPTRAFAEAIAAEWQAQEGKVDPLSMPFTRSANAAIDKVAHQHAEAADMLAEYGDSDLLCYRADHPEGLVARQVDGWDPLLDWAHETYGARLMPRAGVIHAPQDTGALDRLRKEVHALDDFALTAFHDLVSMSGSLVIGLATLAGRETPEALWQISRIDEIWQEEQWGQDEAATRIAQHKRGEFLHAHKVFQLSRPVSA